MNTKKTKILVSILALSFTKMVYSQTPKEDMVREIANFKLGENYVNLVEFHSKIRRDKSLTEEAKAEVYVGILITASEYLGKNKKPQGTPKINITPSDGSMPGVEPASIKDPIVRAEYEKEIAANRSLAEAYIKHGTLSDLQRSIADYCAAFRHMKPENAKLLTTYTQSQTTDPLVIQKVTDLINKEKADRFK